MDFFRDWFGDERRDWRDLLIDCTKIVKSRNNERISDFAVTGRHMICDERDFYGNKYHEGLIILIALQRRAASAFPSIHKISRYCYGGCAFESALAR